MKSMSMRKQKHSAASKASQTLKKQFKAGKGKRNQNKMRNTKGSRKLPKNSGVIYIGHIPHGFYEEEMKSYFNQFGRVTETALARSKKTGRSKGFGFVEFADKEVAKIAAETMNNYLMFNRIIKCRYIPPEERRKTVERGTISATNYPRKKNRIITLKNHRKGLAKLDQAAYLQKVHKKVNQFKKFFEKNGIDFTFKFNEEPKVKQENTAEEEQTKKTLNTPEPKIKEEIENQFGVLEIDESDNDISFKTPPQVKKVIKKSLNSPAKLSKKSALSKKIQTKKEIKMNEKNNKKSKKTQEEKATKKSELKLNNTSQKLERKVKGKVKSGQPAKIKRSSKNEINAVIKQNKLKVKKSVGVKETKKGQVGTIKDKKANKKIKASIKNQSS